MSRNRTTTAWSATAALVLILTGRGPAGSGEQSIYDPDEKVSLDFAWWGNDDRAAMTVAATSCYLIRDADGVTRVEGPRRTPRRPGPATPRHRCRPPHARALRPRRARPRTAGVGGPRACSPGGSSAGAASVPLSSVGRSDPVSPHPPRRASCDQSDGRGGALAVRGVDAEASLPSGGVLDVPGRPTVVHTPGHTDGHCAFYFATRGVLLSGDALVTLDPYTGKRGPQIVANAATKNAATALHSLDALEATEAGVVLTGHGDPWISGIASVARRAGVVGPH